MSSLRIRDIRQGQKALPIEVRVLKKWIPPVYKKPDFQTKQNELCYQFIDIHVRQLT